MHYSREYIQLVRDTVPLSLVVSEFNTLQYRKAYGRKKRWSRRVCNLQAYSGSARHGYYRCLCPFHVEKTPSFFVLDKKGIFKCLGCGEKGDVFEFVMKIRGVSFPRAVRFVALLGEVHPGYMHNRRRKK